MGIRAVPQPPYCPDLALYHFWLFIRLRVCRYETTEEMKEAVTKVIDTLTPEELRAAFQKLLNGTTSALQPKEIILKGTRVLCV